MTTPTILDEPIVNTREFWVLVGYAAILGLAGAAFGLVFIGIQDFGSQWFSISDPGWMGGQWWWVLVTAGAGVVVGLIRIATRLPEKTPGLIDEMKEGSVDASTVPGTVLASAVSLLGGASLGPEKALGAFGGGLGGWLSRRRGLSEENEQVNTLSGFAGAYGGLFSSSLIIVVMLIEVARPGGRRLTKVFLTSVISASVGLGIYFAVAGTVFLGAYPMPAFQYEDWQLLAGVALGLVAAVVVTVLGVIVIATSRLFEVLKVPGVAKLAMGGALFGIIGVALPLTMFTGTSALTVVINSGASLGVGLVLLIVVAKMLAFGVSLGSGFVGGPIFPTLFIGGAMGVALNLVFPGLPLGLTFTCLFAAVPGGIVAAPLSMVLLTAFMTQVGALSTAPALISVITSLLTVESIKYVIANRRAAKSQRRGSGPAAAAAS